MKKFTKFSAIFAAILVVPFLVGATPASAAIYSAPTQKSPASDQTLTTYPRTTSFTWTAVSGAAKYQLEVTCDICVSKTNKWQGAKTYVVSGTSYSVKLPGDNQYRWRVRAIDSSNNLGPWTGYSYFKYRTGSSGSVTTVPVVSYPVNGKSYNLSYIKYDWSDVSSATKYNYIIQRWDSSDKVWTTVKESNTSGSTSNVNVNMSEYDGGQFRFRVQATTSAGKSAWSSWRYFYNNYDEDDDDVSAPSLTSPSDEASFDDEDVTLDWSTVSEATSYQYVVTRYTSSGWVSYLDKTTSNSQATISLSTDGYYSWRVRAKNSSGDWSAWSGYRQFTYSDDDSDDDDDDSDAPYISAIKVNDGGDEGYIDVNDTIAITFNEAIDPESINDDLDEGDYVTGVSYSSTGGVSVSTAGKVTIKNIASFDLGSVANSRNFTVKLALSSSGKVLTITLTSGSDVEITDEDFDSAVQIGGTVEDTDGNEMEADSSITDPTGTFGGDSADDDDDDNDGDVPSITEPDASETFDDESVYMSWTGVSDADSYQIYVEYKSGTSWYHEGTYTTTNLYYTKIFDYDNNYRLKVRAEFSDGDYSDYSDLRYFTVDADGDDDDDSDDTDNPHITAIKAANGGDEDYIDAGDTIAITFNEAIDPESINDDLDEGDYVTGVSYSSTGGVSVSTAGKVTIKNIASFDLGSVANSRNFTVKLALSSSGKVLTITLTSGSDVEITDEDFDSAVQIGGTVEDTDGNEMEADSSITDPTGTFGGENDDSDSAPVIANPYDGETYTSDSVYMSWSSVSGVASYQIEIQYKSGSVWYDEGDYYTSNHYYTRVFTSDNDYRMRVRGVYSGSTYTDWSNWHEFTVDDDGTYDSSTPTITEPENDETFTSETVYMGWTSVSGASSYQVDIDYKSGSSWYDEITYSTSNLYYIRTFDDDNDYRIHVRAQYSGGSYGSWSSYKEFTVNAD